MTSHPPFRLLYNNDATNTAGVPSPWHKNGEPFREEMLVASIEEVARTGVDAYLLSPGMGWVPWWQSEVEKDFYDWWQQRTGLDAREKTFGQGFEHYVARGGDMVRVLVETCRRLGLAPFVSLRLNDVHWQEFYAHKRPESLVSCRFYVEHPEWHIDPNHPGVQGYYSRRGMDWAVPEVRAYKLALLSELARNYDLAGLELDFLRDNTLFRDGATSPAQRVEIITGFVGQVRAALDRGRRGKARRYLGVRIPLELSAHPAIGLDVRRLREAGVDLFNLSGWFHTTQRADIPAVRAQVADAAIFLEMTHSTGWHPYFIKPGLYSPQGDPRTSDAQFYTTALLARRRGADGLSLFNFVYYRSGQPGEVPVREPPFHVLPRLNDLDFLARQGRYYLLGGSCYFRQVPRDVTADRPAEFALEMLGPALTGAPAPAGRLRVHTERALTAARGVAARFNGRPLAPCADDSGFFDNPFDGMISPPGHRRAWVLPGDGIKDGLNTLRIELTDGDPVKIIYVDAGITP